MWYIFKFTSINNRNINISLPYNIMGQVSVVAIATHYKLGGLRIKSWQR
jgi:hypothetical protein